MNLFYSILFIMIDYSPNEFLKFILLWLIIHQRIFYLFKFIDEFILLNLLIIIDYSPNEFLKFMLLPIDYSPKRNFLIKLIFYCDWLFTKGIFNLN